MSDLLKKFRRDVETFLSTRRMNATEFGVKAMNDKGFVHRLRRGTSPTLATVAKVEQFMQDYDGKPDQEDQAAA